MKIVFICASLEAGRDGVGDYTLRLAQACAARGHPCLVLAIHDPHLHGRARLALGPVEGARWPASLPWTVRIQEVDTAIREFAPDWISWQFVAYGFADQGVTPFALTLLANRTREYISHVMLHELWIGWEQGSSARERLVGWRQRRALLGWLQHLAPAAIATSNPTYEGELIRLGFPSSILELFGNVPIDEPAQPATLARFLEDPAAMESMQPPLVGVTFGTLHRQWEPAATVEWLLAAAARHHRPPALVAIGRMGPHHGPILAAFANAGIAITRTGEVDAPTVSQLLRNADFGIAPHPWALIGKSGAAAAMLEHGLPVLVPRDDWVPRHAATGAAPASDPLLARLAFLDAVETDRWLARRRAPRARLEEITGTFLQSLSTPASGSPPDATRSNPRS